MSSIPWVAWIGAASLVGLLWHPQAAAGQGTGEIVGRVTDASGGILPGVRVELRSALTVTPMTTITNAAGRFRLVRVPDGHHQIVFSLPNFSVLTRTVTLQSGASVTVDVALHLALTANVTVTGKGMFVNLADVEHPEQSLVGLAGAATEGAVTARQLETRPILRAGEVLETVPGMVISQHSGEGKANQYYLRGFNLDHGTDVAIKVAGTPVNLPTHGHGHGYADSNFLIPELVAGVQYKKGPYYADTGDFSAAGAVNINYATALERPLVRVGLGGDGWRRLFAAASPRLGTGHLLLGVDFTRNDGPWVVPENYERLNGVVRYSRGSAVGGLSVIGMMYRGSWDATDQVPARAVSSGALSRFGAVDASDGGRTHRHAGAFEWQALGEASVRRLAGYVMDYRLNLFSNFTYFLSDPEHGDQFEQADARRVVGVEASYRRIADWANRSAHTTFGVQMRRDDIGNVGLYRTRARRRLSTVREDQVDQTSLGFYVHNEYRWTDRLRSLAGVRADLYRFHVTSDDVLNSGQKVAALTSPKAGLAMGPWSGTELYVNAGLGFHSNDARGATIVRDPATGEAVEPVTPLVRTKGAEVGIRTVRIPRLQTTLALWTLAIDSELLFIGDAGSTEASRPSRRTGLEWSSYVRPLSWLTIDADLAFSRARFSDPDPSGDRVPGAIESVVSIGVAADRGPIFGSLRLRHFGPRPLVEDNRVRSKPSRLLNVEAGYRFGPRLRASLDIFNLLDARASDIDYFYISRLPGEPSEGVADLHSHPVLPRTARLGLTIDF